MARYQSKKGGDSAESCEMEDVMIIHVARALCYKGGCSLCHEGEKVGAE